MGKCRSENIIPILEQWTKSYPRDLHARHNLAATYSHFGLFDKALVEAEGTYHLNPDFVYACTVLASLYERLNRLDEAKAVCKKAIERGFDSMLIHDSLYEIDFLQADKAGMEQEIEWARGKVMIELQARTAAYYGQLHKYRELWQQSFDSVQETKSRTALAAENRAVTEALIGDASQARRWATFAEKTRQSLSPMGSLDAPLAFALAGDTARAQLLVDQKTKRNPLPHDKVSFPEVRAAIALGRGNPQEAIELLRTASPDKILGSYLRGLAHLRQNRQGKQLRNFRASLTRNRSSRFHSLMCWRKWAWLGRTHRLGSWPIAAKPKKPSSPSGKMPTPTFPS